LLLGFSGALGAVSQSEGKVRPVGTPGKRQVRPALGIMAVEDRVDDGIGSAQHGIFVQEDQAQASFPPIGEVQIQVGAIAGG